MYKDGVEQQQSPFRCKLIVWDRAMDLCTEAYALTRNFPHEEIYGLTSQIRRACVSIPSNIAEGYGRGTREQYKHFLSIAFGSYMELQTQLMLAQRLGYVAPAEAGEVERLASEVGRMLSAMISRLRSAPNP